MAASECCQWVRSGLPRLERSLNQCAGARQRLNQVSDPVQATPGPGQGEDSSRALSALAGARGCDAQCGLKAHAIQPFNDGSQGKVPLVMPPVPRTVGYPCRSSSVVIALAFAAEKVLHQPRLSEGHLADGGNAIRKRLRPGRACRERGRGKHSDGRRKVSGFSCRHPSGEPDNRR
jgi:hypothetical protein